MQSERRQFLAQSARLLSLAALAGAFPGAALSRTARYPFSLGVASGSPRDSSIVLWTRILPDPLDAQSSGAQPYAVQWEIAEDEGFGKIAAKGTATALPELAHSVHVDAAGLKPDRWYWYRFMLGDAVSPIGRTRTAPAANAPASSASSLKLAVASCQHWDFGQYAAHRHIAAEAPDLVAFLGDYIYESGEYALAHPDAPRRRSNESVTLAQYRARYAQYKSDPQLQAAHLAAPWIVTWDDHEVSNDYADDRDERLSANFPDRRAAAYQAFYEHMPIRLQTLPAGPQRFARMRIHDRFDWGRLAQIHLLDNRQYRSYQACQPPGRGGSTSVGAACAERTAPERSLLGAEQEQWLHAGFAASKASWNLLAQQTLMAQCSQVPVDVDGEDGGRFWNDGWDGYPAARRRLLDSMRRHALSNPVVLSGDVHTFYAAELRPDFNRSASNDNPVIATELCATSVTSGSRPQARTERYVADNPHIKYGRSDRRGYMMLDVAPERISARFQALDDVRLAESGVSTLATFVIEEGRPRLQKA